MSKSTHTKKGGGGRKPYARPSFPVAEFKRLGEGRQGLAGARSGAAGSAARRAEHRRRHALFVPLPTLCSCCGCPRGPQDAARLRIVPCSPSVPPSRHRTRHCSEHGPRSRRGRADPGEPEGPGQRSLPTELGSSHSAPAPPGFIQLIKAIGCPKPRQHPVQTSWGQGSRRFVCVPRNAPHALCVLPTEHPLLGIHHSQPRGGEGTRQSRGETQTPDNKSMAKPEVLKSPTPG